MKVSDLYFIMEVFVCRLCLLNFDYVTDFEDHLRNKHEVKNLER